MINRTIIMSQCNIIYMRVCLCVYVYVYVFMYMISFSHEMGIRQKMIELDGNRVKGKFQMKYRFEIVGTGPNFND